MKLKFLGGAGDIGSSAMLMQFNGRKFLFDYGMTPSRPPKYPCPRRLWTHSFSRTRISRPFRDGAVALQPLRCDGCRHATELGSCAPVARGLVKNVKEEGYPEPFNKRELRTAVQCFREICFDEPFEVGDLSVCAHSAGHIPGTTMFELNCGQSVLFTGDINTMTTHLVGGARPVQCDTLIVEGIYAGKEHPDRKKPRKTSGGGGGGCGGESASVTSCSIISGFAVGISSSTGGGFGIGAYSGFSFSAVVAAEVVKELSAV